MTSIQVSFSCTFPLNSHLSSFCTRIHARYIQHAWFFKRKLGNWGALTRKEVGTEKLNNLLVAESKLDYLWLSKENALGFRFGTCNNISWSHILHWIPFSPYSSFLLHWKKVFPMFYPKISFCSCYNFFRDNFQVCGFSIMFLVDDSPGQTDLFTQ